MGNIYLSNPFNLGNLRLILVLSREFMNYTKSVKIRVIRGYKSFNQKHKIMQNKANFWNTKNELNRL